MPILRGFTGYRSANNMLNLPQSPSGEFRCLIDLDLYDSPSCQGLATQAAKGRHLCLIQEQIVERSIAQRARYAIAVRLCEDDYLAWLPLDQLEQLEAAKEAYRAIDFSRSDIELRLPEVIAFTHRAMTQPNYYLWGGTVGPNYDCSGLMQAAFSSQGIWLPRDSYQQEAFTQRISQDELHPGDLIFFAKEKVNHVALYLGDGKYIHSSGKDMGRNGIGIDVLSSEGDRVSQSYYRKLWSFGRVVISNK